MATRDLTPEQQAALEAFEQAAQDASDAHTAKLKADSDLASATLTQQTTSNTDIQDHQAALEAAQNFIDLMVPKENNPPAPPAAPQGKKG